MKWRVYIEISNDPWSPISYECIVNKDQMEFLVRLQEVAFIGSSKELITYKILEVL